MNIISATKATSTQNITHTTGETCHKENITNVHIQWHDGVFSYHTVH